MNYNEFDRIIGNELRNIRTKRRLTVRRFPSNQYVSIHGNKLFLYQTCITKKAHHFAPSFFKHSRSHSALFGMLS